MNENELTLEAANELFSPLFYLKMHHFQISLLVS